jgi:predicted ArsR family transcriptional regulator
MAVMRQLFVLFTGALRALWEGPGAMREAVRRGKAREAAMELAVRKPEFTAQDCAAALGLGLEEARALLDELCADGFLARREGGPPGYRLRLGRE